MNEHGLNVKLYNENQEHNRLHKKNVYGVSGVMIPLSVAYTEGLEFNIRTQTGHIATVSPIARHLCNVSLNFKEILPKP